MTPAQKRCLDIVAAWIAAHGVAPTYREIAATMGGNAQGRAHDLVAALVAQGELIRTAARNRNLRMPTVDLTRVPLDELLAEIERRSKADG